MNAVTNINNIAFNLGKAHFERLRDNNNNFPIYLDSSSPLWDNDFCNIYAKTEIENRQSILDSWKCGYEFESKKKHIE